MRSASSNALCVKENSLKYNLEKAAFAVISGAAFLYLIVKVASMPFILDEATTFVEFVQTGDLLPTESRWTTNNHLLNTGLMWVFYQLFGDDEFVLRLPNLLAFLLYSLATFNLMRRLKSVSLKLLFAVGMVSPMFFLDFFAMARGYGLSFAFLLWACVNWLRAQESKRAYFGAEISFFLAIMANLSIIYLWPAFWLLSAWRDFRLQKVPVKQIVLWRLFSILLIVPHVVYALVLNANFTFDLGTGISIYQSIYSHLLTLFSKEVFSAMSLLAVVVFISFVAFIARQIKPTTELLLFTGMLVVSICVYLLLYVIIDAPLPISRVSLHLFLIWFPGLIFFGRYATGSCQTSRLIGAVFFGGVYVAGFCR